MNERRYTVRQLEIAIVNTKRNSHWDLIEWIREYVSGDEADTAINVIERACAAGPDVGACTVLADGDGKYSSMHVMDRLTREPSPRPSEVAMRTFDHIFGNGRGNDEE